MTYKIIPLSESADGSPIQVAGTDTASADLIHTAINVADDFDQIELFANNQSGTDTDLTIEVGGATIDKLIKVTIPAKKSKLVLPNIFLDTGKTVKVFADTANVINVYGKVGRTT